MTKTPPLHALVLLGGGTRGAFQVGSLLYLMGNLGRHYDIITGTSVGALNGAFLAQYKKGSESSRAILDLQDLWLTINNDKIRKHWFPLGYVHALWKQSLYDSSPLEKLIEDNLDEQKLKNSGVTLRVVATSLESGLVSTFGERSPNIKNAVKASAAAPVFFKPVKIGSQHFIDGGVREITPLDLAIRTGASHITIITTGPTRLKKVVAPELGAIPIAWRVIDTQNTEIIQKDLQRFHKTNEMLKKQTLLDPNKRNIEYIHIGPEEELTDDPLNFNPKKIREMMLAGFDTTKKIVQRTL